MVVNRRISVSTAPPVSRTASTQPTVRAAAPSTPPIPGVHNQTNGPKKERRHTKATRPKRKRIVFYPGPLQVLLLALSAFLVYVAAVCRTDFPRTLPLCRSLDLYRAQIIDPYVLPPVKSIIQRAEPYVSPLKPYAASTANFTRTRITPHISRFIDSFLSYYHAEVTPRLHRLIVDQVWNGVIKPSYFDTLHPTLERHIRPLYNNYLAPGARKGAAYAQVIYVRVLPYTQHYLSNAQKNAARIYEIVQFHVLDLYGRIRPHAVVFLDHAQMQALALAQKAGDLHREFIDPHVRKILDKVAENRDLSSDDSSTDSLTHITVDPLLEDPPSDPAT